MERLTELWYRDGRGGSLLQPLAWGYGALVQARHRAYERGWLRVHEVGKPVIVIGNLTVGGTGKTPLVVWLAERLMRLGFSVGVVSRGYGRAGGGARRVQAGSRWEEVGDEPLLIMRRTGCPLIVAEDRVVAARWHAAGGVDVILSDDGLQHLRLARDCEIVVIDGARGFGNGRLLPAGPLREPASRALTADFLVINGGGGPGGAGGADVAARLDTGGIAEAARRAPSLGSMLRAGAPRAAAMQLILGEAHRVDGAAPPRSLESFRAGPVHAVAGIGHPARFFRDLAQRGLRVIEHAFPDHHRFARGELEFPDDFPILMTEKDAVRCESAATPRQWYVPVEAHLGESDAAALLGLVSARIKR